MSLSTGLAVAAEALDPIDQATGGTTLVAGFIIVGIVGSVTAARLAKKRRNKEDW